MRFEGPPDIRDSMLASHVQTLGLVLLGGYRFVRGGLQQQVRR